VTALQILGADQRVRVPKGRWPTTIILTGRVASRRTVTCLPRLECYLWILSSYRLNDRQSGR
jgi:hypothetical protein